MATYLGLSDDTRKYSYFYIKLTINGYLHYYNIGPHKGRTWDVDDFFEEFREAKRYGVGFFRVNYMDENGQWLWEDVDLECTSKINGWTYDYRNLHIDGEPVGYGDFPTPEEVQIKVREKRDAEERSDDYWRRRLKRERAELGEAILFDKKIADTKRIESPDYLSDYEKTTIEEDYLNQKAKFDNTTLGELGTTIGYREYFRTLNNLYIKPIIASKKLSPNINNRTLEDVLKEKKQIESSMVRTMQLDSIRQKIKQKEELEEKKKQEELLKKKKQVELEKNRKLRDEILAKEKSQELNKKIKQEELEKKKKQEELEKDKKLRDEILAREKLQEELRQQEKRKRIERNQNLDINKHLKRDSSFYSNLTASMFESLANYNLFFEKQMNHTMEQKFLSNFNSKEAIDIFKADCRVHLFYDISVLCNGDCGYALVSSGEDLFFLVRFSDRDPVIYQLNSGQLKMNLLMEIKEVNAARFIMKHQDKISGKYFQSKNEFQETFVDFIRAVNKTIIYIN